MVGSDEAPTRPRSRHSPTLYRLEAESRCSRVETPRPPFPLLLPPAVRPPSPTSSDWARRRRHNCSLLLPTVTLLCSRLWGERIRYVSGRCVAWIHVADSDTRSALRSLSRPRAQARSRSCAPCPLGIYASNPQGPWVIFTNLGCLQYAPKICQCPEGGLTRCASKYWERAYESACHFLHCTMGILHIIHVNGGTLERGGEILLAITVYYRKTRQGK